MEIAFFIGRVLVGFFFIENAFGHLFKNSGTVGYAASKGVPLPKVAVPVTGLMLLAGGLSVLLGAWTFYGIIVLVIFMVPTTLMMHSFWKEADPMARMHAKIEFMKNVAITGALLMLLSAPTPWMYSVIR
jgi:uncharacterized membrane protein YphA (DoxX/SURF4 family)